MTATTEHSLGPGTWELDGTHFPRPLSPITASFYVKDFPIGFAEDTARNGLMLERLAYGQHQGFMYNQARVVGAPPGAATPPKVVLMALSRIHPAIRKRTQTASSRHANKPWRQAFSEWNDVVKPARIATHRALLAQTPEALDDSALAAHIRRVLECYAESARQHGRFTISCQVLIGELIVKLREWASICAEEATACVQSFSPVSAGDEPAASTLIDMLRADSKASALLNDNPDPEVILQQLLARGDGLSHALKEYLDVVGERTLNAYDVAEPRGTELPFLIVAGLRARLNQPADRAHVKARAQAQLQALFDRVPSVHHDELRYLVDEARDVSPLRDERVLYCDYWSAGVLRRALLEVGRRLVAKGQLEHAHHAPLLTAEEVLSALDQGTPPDALAAKQRFDYRKQACLDDVPRFLGPPPSPPPPAEWLPPGIRTTHRATLACLAANFDGRQGTESDDVVRGLGVSAGVYEGPARLVAGPDDFHRLRPGDVLVTRSTSPSFNVVLPLLGALVTDRGGALSHAAIVSREFGIPGVVGCGQATQLLREGSRVRVDGRSGECRVMA